MSKIRDEIKTIFDTLPNIPARDTVLKALIDSAEDVENAAKECRIDKVLAAAVEVEWHRQTVGYLADGLHAKEEISDIDRQILRTTALAVRHKAFKVAENALIDNCGCRF